MSDIDDLPSLTDGRSSEKLDAVVEIGQTDGAAARAAVASRQ